MNNGFRLNDVPLGILIPVGEYVMTSISATSFVSNLISSSLLIFIVLTLISSLAGSRKLLPKSTASSIPYCSTNKSQSQSGKLNFSGHVYFSVSLDFNDLAHSISSLLNPCSKSRILLPSIFISQAITSFL